MNDGNPACSMAPRARIGRSPINSNPTGHETALIASEAARPKTDEPVNASSRATELRPESRSVSAINKVAANCQHCFIRKGVALSASRLATTHGWGNYRRVIDSLQSCTVIGAKYCVYWANPADGIIRRYASPTSICSIVAWSRRRLLVSVPTAASTSSSGGKVVWIRLCFAQLQQH